VAFSGPSAGIAGLMEQGPILGRSSPARTPMWARGENEKVNFPGVD
jgi:hypothetical protein